MRVLENGLKVRMVRTRHDSQSVDTESDRSRVEQLLMNLVGNAVKYSPTGGPVHVAVVTQGRNAEIVISDRGWLLGRMLLTLVMTY